eukprot:4909663-Alexandrium_andersonii.AAC.1
MRAEPELSEGARPAWSQRCRSRRRGATPRRRAWPSRCSRGGPRARPCPGPAHRTSARRCAAGG